MRHEIKILALRLHELCDGRPRWETVPRVAP